MDKLARVRLSSEWERALIASLDKPPIRKPDRRRIWLSAIACVLAGIAGTTVWLVLRT